MGRVLEGSQDQVARQLAGRLLQWWSDGKWEYTSAEAARAEAGFEMMDAYMWRRQNTVAQ